ncbi:MAG TPA: hypothetical protein VFA45_20645 [Actinomycetes bacterium]|nr:hypothetical protein [Actinomycetes bacterium]
MAKRAIPRARGRRLLLGVAVVLALLVIAGRIQQVVLAPHRPAPAPAPSTTIPRALPVTATIELGIPPASPSAEAQLVVGEGRLWALLNGTLVAVDPQRTSTVARIRLGRPGGFVRLLAVGAGAVWVVTESGVVRVDRATAKVTGTLPNGSMLWAGAAAGVGSLWLVRCASEEGPCALLRLDPRRLHTTARFPLPGLTAALPAASLAVSNDSAWLLDRSGRWLWRVDLASGRVARLRLPAADFGVVPGQLAIGEGAVWVLTNVDSPTRLGSRVDMGLVRIDPHTNRVAATTPLANLDSDPYHTGLVVGAGGVWVEGQQRQQDGLAHAVIDRVDPASGRLRGAIETGDPSPTALAAGLGALWLLRSAAGVLLRLDPAAM